MNHLNLGCKASYMRARRMVLEPNASMWGWDCEPALRRPRMVLIPFAANRNLSVFCMNTKRTGCAGCPFHAPDVLCSPQIHGKLINHAVLTCRTRMVQRIAVCSCTQSLILPYCFSIHFCSVAALSHAENQKKK